MFEPFPKIPELQVLLTLDTLFKIHWTGRKSKVHKPFRRHPGCLLEVLNCVKSVLVRVILFCISQHSDKIRRDIKYFSVFSTSAEKYRPE